MKNFYYYQLFFIFIVIFCTSTLPCSGQESSYSINGYIKDSLTGEKLPGVMISVVGKNIGTTSDVKGFYSIVSTPGNYFLKAEYIGYNSKIIEVSVFNHLNVDLILSSSDNFQEEVVITTTDDKENINRIEMGKVEVDIKQTKLLPVLFGEIDLLKSLQLLPGVQAGGEGNTGIYVRGGGPDQNLVLLDDAIVYNTGHLFGFLSVFNTDAIKSLTLYKGNMPSKFGGRISSVLEFKMRDGDNEKYHFQGGIGLIASRVLIEGPIKKGKSSFIISGRRTYIDQLSKPFFQRNGTRGFPYYFYDINAKANYFFSDKNKLFFTAYRGSDEVKLTLLNGRVNSNTGWGNSTNTLRWNHVFNEKLMLNTILLNNSYSFNSSASYDNFETKVESKVNDYTLKSDLDYYYSLRQKFNTGISISYHTFLPRKTDASATGVTFNPVKDEKKYAYEVGYHISDEIKISERLETSIGLRLNLFQQLGPYNYPVNPQKSEDTIVYKDFEPVVSYLNPEPRIGIRYLLNEKSSIKTSFNLNNQYIHLVSVSGNSLPFDMWIPSTKYIKPQRGWQYSLGYFRNFSNNNVEFSIEGYYKKLYNLIEYKEDYVIKISENPEAEFVFGEGKAYGMEFLLKKSKGRFDGWIGYTWSKSTRSFPDINFGKEFPSRYDRRHDISLVGTYALNASWTLGVTFVYATGQAITIPERRYFVGGVVYNQYGPRNGFRMEAYHRMDLSATYEKKGSLKRFHSSWTFAVYNLYNRKNPYVYFVDALGDVSRGRLNITAKKLYLFPIMPSITWNFKF